MFQPQPVPADQQEPALGSSPEESVRFGAVAFISGGRFGVLAQR